jgi:hypothetical protein
LQEFLNCAANSGKFLERQSSSLQNFSSQLRYCSFQAGLRLLADLQKSRNLRFTAIIFVIVVVFYFSNIHLLTLLWLFVIPDVAVIPG